MKLKEYVKPKVEIINFSIADETTVLTLSNGKSAFDIINATDYSDVINY